MAQVIDLTAGATLHRRWRGCLTRAVRRSPGCLACGLSISSYECVESGGVINAAVPPQPLQDVSAWICLARVIGSLRRSSCTASSARRAAPSSAEGEGVRELSPDAIALGFTEIRAFASLPVSRPCSRPRVFPAIPQSRTFDPLAGVPSPAIRRTLLPNPRAGSCRQAQSHSSVRQPLLLSR